MKNILGVLFISLLKACKIMVVLKNKICSTVINCFNYNFNK